MKDRQGKGVVLDRRRTSDRLLLFLFTFLLAISNVLAQSVEQWEKQCSNMTPKCPCKGKDGLNYANCSSRSLTRLPEGDLTEMQSIELSYNQIVTLNDGEFSRSGLINLKRIVLSYNLIRDIQPGAFRELKLLLSLDLSHNQLDKIDPDVFLHLTSLQALKLDGNKLYTFTRAGTFPPLPALIAMSLNANSFERLSPEVFGKLDGLRDLELLNNPWQCDCELRSFHNWIIQRKLVGKTMCNTTAPFIEAKSWDVMSSNDFVCSPVIRTFKINENHADEVETIVSAEAESDLTIECHIEGDPMPTLTWYKDDKNINALNRDPSPRITAEDCPTATTDRKNRESVCSKLVLGKLTTEDSGRFVCTGENNGGSGRRLVRLTVTGGGVVLVTGGSSQTWIWILIGLLFFILLVVLIVTLVFYILRRKKQQQRKRVGDVSTETLKKQKPPADQTDDIGTVTSPLIGNSDAPITIISSTADPNQYPRPVIENGFSLSRARAGTPMPQQQGPDYVVPQHGSLKRLPPFISGSQILVPQEIYHPAGYATYDPRQASLYAPLNFRQQPIYGRLQSPFSGSVASFSSEPPVRILPGPGYVTLPRRRRVPSWSPANYATGRAPVPPSPTPSLPVPNLKARYIGGLGPRYDTLGRRTTADGGSNLSLNKAGIPATPTARTPAGFMTPGTPSSPEGSVFSRGPSTPLSGRIPKANPNRRNYNPVTPTHFNFDTIQETEDMATPSVNDTPWSFSNGKANESNENNVQRRPDSLKIAPQPPVKPKRRSANLEEQEGPTPISSIQGTEV